MVYLLVEGDCIIYFRENSWIVCEEDFEISGENPRFWRSYCVPRLYDSVPHIKYFKDASASAEMSPVYIYTNLSSFVQPSASFHFSKKSAVIKYSLWHE